ncbi:DUF5666 domain-containing protein [Leifsonia sp. LS1]|uniref:DUF5666 domain-containing protein n=1 Tax=Leifsonia sp. LS1 TaxID=2828483 RepID=UPI001CFE2D84|nr:DUF5666 domain-containing protein [Leifsonia sp. LS1]
MNDETDPTQPLPSAPDTRAAQPGPVTPPTAAQPGTASSTATGFVHRHAVGVAVAAGVLAVVLLAGGTAWGVSAAVAAAQPTASMSSTALDHTAASKKASSAKASSKARGSVKRKAHGVRGTIAAIDGSTWTVHTANGATVTVTIASTTAFGTAAKPAERSSFAVGDRVGVLGMRSGDTVTAKRIVMLPASAHTGTPTPAPTA